VKLTTEAQRHREEEKITNGTNRTNCTNYLCCSFNSSDLSFSVTPCLCGFLPLYSSVANILDSPGLTTNLQVILNTHNPFHVINYVFGMLFAGIRIHRAAQMHFTIQNGQLKTETA